MKKFFFAVAAFAALIITSCQERVEPQEIEEQAISAYTFNFTVSSADVTTKAIKSGWETGDIINLWFDGATGDPQAILTYNGETETWVGTQLATDLDLGEAGRVSALYEGHNDLSKLRNNVPLVLENENADYSVDGAKVSATLNNWYYETPIQLVVPGIAADYADYSLSCADLYAGSWLFLYDRAVTNSDAHYTEMSISGSSLGQATTGVENADGAAFYYKSSNSTESKAFTFTLSYNGKDYTYTSGNTVISVTTTKNRVNKKLPEFKIDENGNPVSGCKWSLVGGEDPVNGYVKVTAAPTDWSGQYLLVYESSETEGLCWTGVDAANCYATAIINSNEISEIPDGAVTLTIASINGGYSIKVNGGDNDGKFISGTSGSNVLKFETTAQLNTIGYSEDGASIVSNTSVMRFNKASNNMRFRYFKSASYSSQEPVQLYKYNGTIEVVSVTGVTLSQSVLELEVGDTETLDATVLPENATNKSVTWSSDNETVATVENGVVTAVGEGTATITVTTVDGEITDECVVTVTASSVSIANTVETAYTASEAIAIIEAGKDLDTPVYVKGVVSEIVTEFSSSYGNISFNVSADGKTTGDQFQFFRNFKGADKTKWTDSDAPRVGDYVIGYGTLTKYGSTYEFAEGNYIVSIERAPYLEASASKVSGISAEGETVTITVDTNIEGWTVTSDNTAFVVGEKSGNTVSVVVSKNETDDIRTATITVSADGVDNVEITLIQAKPTSGATIPSGTTLWAENFAHFGTNTPSAAGTGTGTTIYGNATITYAQSSTNTKGYNETLAGGTAPELLLSKSNQTWTISGICCDGASEMTLTFISNRTTFAVSSSTKGISVSGSQKSWTITNSSAKTFEITIENTGTNNARIDDVVLKVK